jgi:hypothetical protein
MTTVRMMYGCSARPELTTLYAKFVTARWAASTVLGQLVLMRNAVLCVAGAGRIYFRFNISHVIKH